MSVVDASVWVAMLMPHEAGHSAARAWLERHVSSQAPTVLPALALAEVAGAVSRRTGDVEAGARTRGFLLSAPRVRVQPLDLPRANSAARIAAERLIRGPDAVYVALALEEDDLLVTLDAEIEARASALVRVLVPVP